MIHYVRIYFQILQFEKSSLFSCFVLRDLSTSKCVIVSLFTEHLQKPIVTCPICQKGFHENAAYKHHMENVCGDFNEQKASKKTEENLSSDSNSTNNHQENDAVSHDQNNTIGDKQELQSDVSNSKLPSKNPESAPETLSDDAFKSKFCELHPTKKDKYGCTECHKSFNTLYNLKRHVYSGTVSICLS